VSCAPSDALPEERQREIMRRLNSQGRVVAADLSTADGGVCGGGHLYGRKRVGRCEAVGKVEAASRELSVAGGLKGC
jgi:hypothetical protein